jgi:uncharacterized membrane protein SirB2
LINPVLTVHVATALLSISGFIFRGILHFRSSELVNRKWFKITPHIVDTLLIVSALILLNQSGLNILNTSWLLAKVIALIVYISLGLIAFRFGKTRGIRLMAWLEAILVFAYILGVAVTKNPLVLF